MKKTNMVKKNISIKMIIIVPFIIIMLTAVVLINYIVFSNWLSSAEETTTTMAEDISNLHSRKICNDES